MKSVLLTFYLLCNSVFLFAGVSGTLPVMYINTDENKPIVDKVNYITATYYIDDMGIEGIESVGTKDNPLSLQIRGRGNFTWNNFDKKPYRIKLDKKQSLLGMKKSKHFALLAHADNDYAFFRNTVAFEISKRLEMAYTPEQRPVEVVLNGDYIGLYFLTETIRVDADRVHITEQADGETQEDFITGGWLVEIDNNGDDNQIQLSVDGTDLEWFWITYHSPEILSNEQKNYLFNQFEGIKSSIYTEDKSSTEWESYIEMTSLAKYYIIQEAVDHLEGFLGSCYLYKDLGETKWKWGPVWDFGHAFNKYHSKEKFIYQDSPFPVSIINEIAEFPNFQQEVKRLWSKYYSNIFDDLDVFIHDFAQQIATAAVCDKERWPNYGDSDVITSSNEVISSLRTKVLWLNDQWSSVNGIATTNNNHPNNYSIYYDMSGCRIDNPQKSGVYIIKEYLSDGSVRARKVVIQ